MEDRLVDFAVKTKWGYMNFEEMLFGIYCIKKFELCEPEFQVTRPATTYITHGYTRSLDACYGRR